MSQRRALSRVAVPLGLTAALLVAQLAAVPPLSDPVTGAVPRSLHLATPWLYLVLAPVFTLWDGVSMLSMSRLKGLLVGLAVLYAVWRALVLWRRRRFAFFQEFRALAVTAGLFTGFVMVGALWHRPMLSLAGTDREDIVVDFHSHTNVSHDVRDTWMQGFDAEANRRWHARAGFDAAFITDHNIASHQSSVASRQWSVASRQSPVASRESGAKRRWATVLCPGTEVSAWRAHIILLGNPLPVDRRRHNGSLEELLTLLMISDSAYRALSVASLPEYRRNHWDRLDQLVAAGLDGFEIVNASPKANEITQTERDSVIALARRRNRLVLGVSDSHGWGATSMVWNLVRAPAGPAAEGVCAIVLGELRRGFSAVRVIERHRLRPEAWWPIWLTPLGVVWETWRGMGWAATISWLAWIWIYGFSLRSDIRRAKIGF